MELTYILVFLISAGIMFLGAISGGVGLVLRPLLIFLGFPAINVVGSVRFAAIFGEIPSIYLLHKNKKIDWKLVLFLVIPTFIGSIIASIAVISILKNSLELIIGFVLLIVGFILLIKKNKGLEEKKYKFSKKNHLIGFIGTLVISFFNTITGGMGPIFSSLYIANYRKSYITASALSKTASYIGTGIASLVFVISGVVDYKLFIAF